MKKLLLFNCLSIFSFICAANQETKPSKTYVVYSHGFGERGGGKDYYSFLGDDCSAPMYPDAPEHKGQAAQLNKAVFYTKPAVHTLANHLNQVAQKEDCARIVLVGNSCGVAIADNCLASLAHYKENIKYFEGSDIVSSENSENIMVKINNGAYVQTAPLMHLRKAKIIALPSSVLAKVTIAAPTVAACYFAPSLFKDDVGSTVVQTGCLVAGLAAYHVFGDYIKNAYANGIVNWIIPYVTNNHFDPYHANPQQSVEQLRGKLTCPILMQFHEQDGVVENPDEDTVKRYDALKGEKTHIVITNDAWHNARSAQFAEVLEDFNKQLKGQRIDMKATQPTVDELRKQIFTKKAFLK